MNHWSHRVFSLLGCVLISLVVSQALLVQAEGPVVRAVLFYSPSCSHCHKVISEDLPPLIEKYGEQLEIVGVNTAGLEGQALYGAAVQRFNIPRERLGVPTLIVGDVVLVGSAEIPQQFPGLIEKYLEQGGVDWPDIPGLAEGLATAESKPSATPVPRHTSVATIPPTSSHVTPTAPGAGLIVSDDQPSDLQDKLARDPLGNTISIIVLTGMVFVVGYVGVTFQHLDEELPITRHEWAIPMLSLIGLGVAGYLGYVEAVQVTAVCGPVGDCNAVQQSKYALLFGIMPVGVLGVIGYMAILIAWIASYYGRGHGQGRLADLASLALLAMTLFGTLFSIYLTFLEPFVIGATCAWCLTSAIVMTLLLWLAVAPGKGAISNLFRGKKTKQLLFEGLSPSREGE